MMTTPHLQLVDPGPERPQRPQPPEVDRRPIPEDLDRDALEHISDSVARRLFSAHLRREHRGDRKRRRRRS